MTKYLIGERYQNLQGYWYEIIDYGKKNYRKIKFDSGYIAEVHISNIARNKCKDWLSPSVCGVGIVGQPNLRKHPLYIKWKNMIYRCYYPKFEFYQYYGGSGVKVSEELLLFTSFIDIVEKLPHYEDMMKNPSEWQVDKDMKSNEVKIYSKETLSILKASDNQWLAMEQFHKTTFQYSLDGSLIKTYDNLLQVYKENPSYSMSNIVKAINGKYRHAYGYIWLNEENEDSLQEKLKNIK